MDTSTAVQALLEQMNLQRTAYLETVERVERLLTQQLQPQSQGKADDSTSANIRPVRASPPFRPSFSQSDAVPPLGADFAQQAHRKSSSGLSTLKSSSISHDTADGSDTDNDESLYVQDYLESQQYDQSELRDHLSNYEWDEHGKQILYGIAGNESRIRQPYLFPVRPGPAEDRSHFTAFQVFDVGPDGAPLLVDGSENTHNVSRAMAIWNAIESINPPSKPKRAVGRITILREPSPILFGAIHYTTHGIFDTDELFTHLAESASSSANMHRAFDSDPRKQCSFVFNLEYFTIVGEDCKPMRWQLADRQEERKANHIAITRCSSVVALSLSGRPIRKVRNPSRRAKTAHGYAYDPWASWQILNLQCFPDWNSSTDTHDSTKHYVNGVEAFMVTLLTEYTDAERRFEEICKQISHLITPPLEFMFDTELRDKLLFEDDEFTYSRRYFWAYQTIGIITDSIRALIDAYEDTFTDDVWEGKHKTLWPLVEEGTDRNKYFLRKMAVLRRKFEVQIKKLRQLIDENDSRRAEIRGLRDQLFSGTSVLESRKSVEMTAITIQQGHNIKLLTLVSIFFLPLTFVTSVFGMTNMPADHDGPKSYEDFALVLCIVCIPFFVLIGSLNTTRGMHFWRSKSKVAAKSTGHFFSWLAKGAFLKKKNAESDDSDYKSDISSHLESGRSPPMDELKMRRASHVQQLNIR